MSLWDPLNAVHGFDDDALQIVTTSMVSDGHGGRVPTETVVDVVGQIDFKGGGSRQEGTATIRTADAIAYVPATTVVKGGDGLRVVGGETYTILAAEDPAPGLPDRELLLRRATP